MRINKSLIFLLLLPVIISAQNAKIDSFYVANWNMENLYDTQNDSLTNDEEFLPESNKNWTDDRLEQKLTNLVKVINYMNKGCGPDVLAMEEIENIMVMKRLIYKMRDRDYVIVHRNSPDRRGIDVGLIYDRSVFTIDSVEAIHVELPTHSPTRDILHTILIHKKTGKKVHFYVNHWPSRLGGEEKSNINRVETALVLKRSLDSLKLAQKENNVIILGDFNDEPANESITETLGAKDFSCGSSDGSSLLNLSYKKFAEGEGSYLYNGKFEMIDQIIISPNFVFGNNSGYECGSFEIIKPQFIIYESGRRKGGAIPTYEGSKYIGGFSDHFPVGAKFKMKEKNEAQ